MRAARIGLAVLWAWGIGALPALPADAAGERPAPRRDRSAVFEALAEARRLETRGLWPGFDPEAIPLAVFDGRDTYLFGFGRPPKGFKAVSSPVAHMLHRGPHPEVRGNRRIMIDGVWAASVVLGEAAGPPTGAAAEAYPAAVIIHEKFHAYQALRHPGWRPNDAVLLRYPLDTPESLALRRVELACFERAAAAFDLAAAAGWAAAALDTARDRLGSLPPAFGFYERQLQLLEGLAEYVQVRASGRVPLSLWLGRGFAPAAVRELGYIEGWHLAGLLDRFDPGWKEGLERGEFDSLGERLRRALPPQVPASELDPVERAEFLRLSERDCGREAESRREILDMFEERGSIRIEIAAEKQPFLVSDFDPFTIETPSPTAVLHRSRLRGRIGAAAIEIARPCLIHRNAKGEFRRIVTAGFSRRPLLPRGPVRSPVRTIGPPFRWEGVSIEGGHVAVSDRGNTVLLTVR